MKDTNFNVNEYLPLRDVVFNTLRQAIITFFSNSIINSLSMPFSASWLG